MAPSSLLQQQSNHPSPDGVHQPNNASHTRQPLPPPRTTGMFAHTSTLAARLKARRSSPSSSSSPPSPSSSSSSESLSPRTFEFKRSRRHQQRPRAPSLLPLPRAPHSLGEQVDDAQCFATQISSSPPETPKIYPDQVCSLSGSTDPPLPITSQEGNPFILAQPWDSGGTQCVNIGKHCNFDEKDTRKLLMWRAACAMAHAYVHQHDSHHHKLNHHGLRELQQLDNGGIDKEGLYLHEDSCNGRSATSTESAPPSSPIPPRAKISTRDKMYPLPICPSDDVVCIDEVVNPTQAAEWFGTLFLSTSALVS
ncbi:hypothetical protein L7F22_000195 [Adiantum nelumboides]|nr:hypothetical protein [Adiantum nelumboides]